MVRADGTPIIVQVDKDFAVTAVQTGGPGGGRHGGPGAGPEGQMGRAAGSLASPAERGRCDHE